MPRIDPNDYKRERWDRCEALFSPEEHQYVTGYGWLISPVALRHRLDTIDLNWSTSVKQVGQLTTGGLQALGGVQAITVTGELTMFDATRSAMGAAPVQRDDKQITAEALIKALDQAQDILLMTLAQQWNIGAYCKDIPKDITTIEQLAEWLGRE